MKASQIMLARRSPPSAFNFYPTREDAIADMPRANTEQWSLGGYEVMTMAEFVAIQRAFMLADPLVEIDEDRFMEMLEVLPPENWHRDKQGVQKFFMSEYQTASYTEQYAQFGERYFVRVVDVNDESTWITRKEIEAMPVVATQEGVVA